MAVGGICVDGLKKVYKERLLALIDEMRAQLAQLPDGPEVELMRQELEKMERIAEEKME